MRQLSCGSRCCASFVSLALGVSFIACASDYAPRRVGRLDEAADLSTTSKQIALGKAHGCSLDPAISGVVCWGDNRRGQTDVPSLSAPSFVAAGGDTSCAIADGSVQCWGDGTHGQQRVPLALRQPTQLAVGDAHVCALAESDEIRCWGDDSFGRLNAPSLRQVQTVAAGARHTCALADGAVSCWGDNALGQLDVPALADPSRLAVGGDHACVIDSGKVTCWGGSGALIERVPGVVGPSVIATGASHACVIDAEGVKCWGDDVSGDLTPRELTNPIQLAVGGGDGWSHACARHLQGVACWGDDSFGQVSYDGAPLHLLYRSEARIAAPAARVWEVLMDLPRYPDWNPYTIAMQSTLQIGDPMIMSVKMSESLTLEQTEYIRVLEPGHKVCWGIDTDSPEFNSGERCQWLEELPQGGTLYVTEDLIEGTANPLVTALFGDAVENGFDAVALALKEHLE
jgi:Regulator of chromosome condensation (RCC1) repeat